MDRNLRRRFWFEATSSIASAVLLGATLVWPDWIELAFGVDPDNGSGLLEWLIVLVTFTVLLSTSTLARREWRRSLAPGAPGAQAAGSSGQV